ncbi:MAG: polymer-forming cytoskeletal protein [Eubacterium sp.]|nr:polymer-forming cytoskeletal protein [Eubacterium sp.]
MLEDNSEEVKEIPIEVATAAVVAEDNSPETSVWEEIKEESKEEKETKKEESLFRKETPRKVDFGSMLNEEAVSDQEVSTITKGMTINGDIESTGSLNIDGKVNGNVTSKGKVVVTGNLTGNTNAVEFFADSARVKGEINATGKVKVGDGSVIVGNITATSAVIAGAVKGDIDVHGPVIVDTTAVIMGNIKSQSVQINNGAAIEGFCSQVYADVKYDDLFGDAE